MNKETIKRISEWKNAKLEASLKEELNSLNDDELNDAFYRELAFGTGGLRGTMGVGTNRLNIYTINKASQGVANYIKKHYQNASIAIGYDTRLHSQDFAMASARVYAANGIKVYIYKETMPTPALSFAVRYLKTSAGVVVTASHNPKEYNGYKVYGDDGCQIGLEVANEILEEINEINPFNDVKEISFEEGISSKMINWIGEDLIEDLFKYELSLSKELETKKDIKIVYSPLNGSGLRSVTTVLKRAGYDDVNLVMEQVAPDGNFPTIPFPNPELKETLTLGLKKAKDINADILIATDPDCDRVGVAINHNGEFVLLTGNQVGILMIDYLLEVTKVNNPVIVKTIVSSDMVKEIAKQNNATLKEVLTGFKFIGEQIAILENNNELERYLIGFEESCGYLTGTRVRDKDAINACLIVSDLANHYHKQGISVIDHLNALYKKYGYSETSLMSFSFPGEDGMNKMNSIMKSLRSMTFDNVLFVEDYLAKTRTYVDHKEELTLPSSDVMKLTYKDNSTLTIRPSGTEPKIKVYFYITGKDENETKLKKDNFVKIVSEIFK